MVGVIALLSASVVNDGRQIREVSVQVDVLSIVSPHCQSFISATLSEDDLDVCLGYRIMHDFICTSDS